MPNKAKKSTGRAKRPQKQVRAAPSRAQPRPAAKQTLGSKIGSGLGGMLGNLAQKSILKLFGKGDYAFEVGANSLTMPTLTNSVPLFGQEDGAIRVRHREYLGDLQTSTAFSNRVIVIDPSNSACFPWISRFASNFEQWRMLGCVFDFRSMTALATTVSASLGTVTFSTQYNALSVPFANKVQANNHFFASSTVPYRDMLHPIECKDAWDPLKVYYTRGAGDEIPGSTPDARFSTFGNLNIVTQGAPSAFTCGELWITYDLLLIKPRLSNSLAVLIVDPPDVPDGPPPPIEVHVPEWTPSCCDEMKERESERVDEMTRMRRQLDMLLARTEVYEDETSLRILQRKPTNQKNKNSSEDLDDNVAAASV